jgi:hypothetical protein
MMSPEAKKALARAIRGLRAELIAQLGEAMEQRYKLSIAEAGRAALDARARVERARLEAHVDEEVRGLPVKERAAARARLQGALVKDAAATFVQRLVYLRLLEAAGLRPVLVVTGGWDARGYQDFRAVAPALVGDDTEGYATLLQLVFDDLAHELPGLYGPVRMTALVPLPVKAWRAVLAVVNDRELESVWTDDTALGWIYQYWNDPEREALDAKLAAREKLANHELASKTQMFTERYMVEWLLHNSLGQQWLALCKRHGWVADVERTGVLAALEARRADWRARRETGEVALDALMPIADGLEDRWKYWVPQPLPADAATSAPTSIRELKVLDPACGSGHFLVIAMDLLFALYHEEARHRGVAGQAGWTDRDIVEAILERNLFGIDIDPRAVQIAAAALLLKARGLCRDATPRTLNLVAPALGLAALPADDPARVELCSAVEAETGLPHALTARVLDALAGADHLGTLLRVDTAVAEAVTAWEGQLAVAAPDQGSLWDGFGARPTRPISAAAAQSTVLQKLERFLDAHSSSADLGLRLHGEQLAAGVRFLRMVREGQYDLVVANPPYQGTSKMADKAYVEKHYPRGKADLYAAFLERGLQLVKDGGVSAMLTMRNWMFLTQYTALRTWLIETWDLRTLGDVDRGAFEEIPDEVVSAVMSVFRKAEPGEVNSVAVQPTPLDDKARDGERTQRKRAALLCQRARSEFRTTDIASVGGSPLIYWWTNRDRSEYVRVPKYGEITPVRQGLCTGNNTRVLRFPFELPATTTIALRSTGAESRTWHPFLKGGEGRAWFEPMSLAIDWTANGLGVKTLLVDGKPAARPQNEAYYFRKGIAFTTTGAVFEARCHRYAGIFGDKGRSVFPDEPHEFVTAMNSSRTKAIMGALNPTIDFTVGDVERLPFLRCASASDIFEGIELGFADHESHREASVEFKRPGPSPWRHAQEWAQLAVDRPEGAPLPPYEPVLDPEPPTDHLSFALGVALARFGAATARASSPPRPPTPCRTASCSSPPPAIATASPTPPRAPSSTPGPPTATPSIQLAPSPTSSATASSPTSTSRCTRTGPSTSRSRPPAAPSSPTSPSTAGPPTPSAPSRPSTSPSPAATSKPSSPTSASPAPAPTRRPPAPPTSAPPPSPPGSTSSTPSSPPSSSAPSAAPAPRRQDARHRSRRPLPPRPRRRRHDQRRRPLAPPRPPVERPQEVVERARLRHRQERLRLVPPRRPLLPHPRRHQVPPRSLPRRRPRLLLALPPRPRLRLGTPPPGRTPPRLPPLRARRPPPPRRLPRRRT